ncbi:hypothetical protein HYDPIDRAFT_117017 [Hydnomerulius pinastri MD-312]|uniref:Uncharacterized protein n=1 Tax=Hydnomerulius pinastri MD-312 TaxID=994086 RepID=A0A0C9V4Q4_9AGAM|nr:hypothetical protein HYDPIDRAFT_117017 [Hydnomerulius pinastri MD-312]
MSFTNAPNGDKGGESVSGRPGETSPTTTLYGNHAVGHSGPPGEGLSNKPTGPKGSSPPVGRTDTDVLIVDWDGPDDPQNPKK